MGRPSPSYNRILKVVLPNSFFAGLVLRRAPRLRYFPLQKGVFIRPSWPRKTGNGIVLKERRATKGLTVVNRLSTVRVSLSTVKIQLMCDRPSKRGGGVALVASKCLYPCVIFKESLVNAYELMPIGPHHVLRHMFEQLIKAIGDLACSDTHFLLLGDLNLPDVLWRRGEVPKPVGYALCALLNCVVTHGSNILDLLLVNNLELVTSTQVLAPIGSSDHSSIQFELNIEVDREIITTFKRDFKAANYDLIVEYLNDVDWYASFNNVDSVNDKYEMFLTILNHAIELFVPLKTQKTSGDPLPQYLISKAIASGNSEDWHEYKKISSIFERKLYKFRSHIEKNISQLRLKKSKGVCVLFSEDGKAARQDREKAELLADIFEKAYQKEVDLAEVETSPSFPVMSDSLWFQREEIHKLLA
ncbi:hypothetical protein OSTOST_16537, partial [Ostertagia ostertagi]